MSEQGSSRRADDVDKFIGQQLRIRRLLMGISQERLAREVGVSFQQIQKYESGVNRISARTLFYISQLLDVQVDYFFKGLDSRNLALSGADVPDEEEIKSSR